ncbi:retron St85 family effector protein [Pseudoxanthomonas sp. PXM02]|uniref:retron St85 family effector protein n=1 Tax=Pseudoxanthomonas sp. PXM02 TaxID=2769294 RepID=UPI00177D2425|nr:retron St85 family effector protein [Pseudoxanthomonas sp. PXM02]MBD9480577.1 hypothetical protein [Pseudoxanthomonas sp. PXM02]
MADPRAVFLARIDLSATRVKPFEGFVFLCGGPQDIKNLTPERSVRNVLYNAITSGRNSDLAQRLKLAEDIQDWYRGGKYDDLVTFEEHLASLSSVILLVVESAGSIAELGAFAVTDVIAERLLALISEAHFEEDSFIKLGPINRLESRTGRKVLVYPWHDKGVGGTLVENFDLLKRDLPDILAEVRTLLGSNNSERVFKQANPAHVMMFVCEMCDLFGALSENEIASYLREVGCEVDRAQLEQYLFLLERCDLLLSKARGHGRYFYAPNWRSHIVFGFRDSKRVDRDRLTSDVIDYYRGSNKTRFSVISELRQAL